VVHGRAGNRSRRQADRGIGARRGRLSQRQRVRLGNVEIAVYDLASEAVQRTVLHPHLQQDDPTNPRFLPCRTAHLAVYTQHGVERRIYYRRVGASPIRWRGTAGDIRTREIQRAAARQPTSPTRTSAGCFRSHHELLPTASISDPNYMYSD